METQTLNVYILNDNPTVATKLKRFLEKRFGAYLNISTFNSSKECIERIDSKVNMVVLDDYLSENGTSQTGLELLQQVKAKDANVEVVILSNDDDMDSAVKAIELGARGFIPNKHGAWSQLLQIIVNIVNAPINFLVREFRVTKFVAIFTMTFITVGIVVLIALNFIYK